MKYYHDVSFTGLKPSCDEVVPLLRLRGTVSEFKALDSELWSTFPGEVVKSLDSEVHLGSHGLNIGLFLFSLWYSLHQKRCSRDLGATKPCSHSVQSRSRQKATSKATLACA